MIFKVPSNPNHSMSLRFYDICLVPVLTYPWKAVGVGGWGWVVPEGQMQQSCYVRG